MLITFQLTSHGHKMWNYTSHTK